MTQPNIETEIPVDRSRLGAAAMRLSAALLIFAALAVVYARALNVPFVFDDTVSIVKNPSIVRLWPLFGVGGNPGPLNPTSGIPTAGRPLVNLSFAINYHFGGLNTFGYRLFNLILHAMSALLIWRILARALRLDYFAGRFDRAAEPLALAVALLWAVHPLNTETIIYTTQRTELMVGLFYLATFYGCLRYWGAQSPAARTGWLIVTTVACLVGAGCKEVIATAPLIMLIFERTFISGTFERALRRSWPLYVGMILSWLVLIGLNLSSPRSGTAGFNVQGLPVLAWWFTQAKVFLIYLKLVVWPWPLAIHYEFPLLTTVASAWPWLLATTLIVLATLILLWRHNAVGFICAWVLAILAPTSIIPLLYELAAERRMYLPLAGLIALIVVGVYSLLNNRRWLVATMAISLALAIVCAAVSMHRLLAYRDTITLWRDIIAAQPQDYIAYNNLGVLMKDSGKIDEAIALFEQSLRIKPDDPNAHGNLGNIYGDRGQTQLAIEHDLQAVAGRPYSSEAHYNLAVQLDIAGKTQEAMQQYQQALQINPDFPDALNALGLDFDNLGQTQQAIQYYQRALQLNPDLADAHNNWGNALGAEGDLPRAIEQYQLALRSNPNFPEAHNNLAFALARTGQLSLAIQHYRQALHLRPHYALAAANLALAYSQTQQPDEAIVAAQEAISFAKATHQTQFAEQVQDWLNNYRAGLSQPDVPKP